MTMGEYENPLENSPEKGKWFTYGGKVDEHLMSALKDVQKTAGIKKFSDFMNDMLRIYRENKQDAEPPQMQVVKKAITDIITTTESLLRAMQIIEADKFNSIADYQQRTQEAEENTLRIEDQVSKLEQELADINKELVMAQNATKSANSEITAEIERRKNIEGMIKRIQQLADDALSQKEKAETERNRALEVATDAKNKIALLEAINQEMQTKYDAALVTMKQNQEKIILEKNNNKKLSETLTRETIARNRYEEHLQIIEPQYQAAKEKLEGQQIEISKLLLSEQILTQKSLQLESELQTATAKFHEFQIKSKLSHSKDVTETENT